MPTPVTDAELLAIRGAIIKILGMPRPGVACVFIVAEERPGGEDRQRMGCLGLSKDGIVTVLAQALETALNDEPNVSLTLYRTPAD